MIPATSLRAVGATGVHVSALGVGTATFGDVFGVLGPDTAHQVVAAAVDAGLRYFDTAPLYGNGLAETRLGRALSDLGNPDVTISTKVGRMLDEHEPEGRRFDLSRDGIRRSLESSLVRLGRDRVDIVLLHDVDDFEHEVYDTAWAAVCELRDEGLVDAVGFGMNQWQLPLRFVERLDVDVVMLAGRRTLLDPSAALQFLPAAAAAGVAVLTAGVYNSGALTDPSDGAWYDYRPAPPAILAKARDLRSVAERHGATLAQAALQFCHRDPRSTSTVVGIGSVEMLELNLEALAEPISDALWAELEDRGLVPEWAQPPTAGSELRAVDRPTRGGSAG